MPNKYKQSHSQAILHMTQAAVTGLQQSNPDVTSIQQSYTLHICRAKFVMVNNAIKT